MFNCSMTYSLTKDEKKFLYMKHKDLSYMDINKFQKELKKMIIDEEKNKIDLDKEFKLKFKNLR